jgi:hypothetical protein
MNTLLSLAIGSSFWVAVLTVLGMIAVFVVLFFSERKK